MHATDKQFEAWVREHQRTVFGIALRFLGDRGEAEEIAQDVFLALYDALPGLESEEHLRFWLRKVAVHRSTDALRRRKRRPEDGAELWDEQAHGCSSTREAGGEMRGELEQLVRSLPEPYRTAVILRYTEDAEPGEIALLTGQPLATVKSNLQRGLKMLRRKADFMMKDAVKEMSR